MVLAARMLDQSSGHQPDWNNDNAFDGHSLTEAAAGSTVMRGLLYSLMHPAARRFLSLKSPALFANNKAAGLNKEQLQAMCWSAHRSVCCVLQHTPMLPCHQATACLVLLHTINQADEVNSMDLCCKFCWVSLCCIPPS